ncbi:hypothetical protein D6825_02435 [Candidatus Woesearchaeota archaeon]|nr:MAG: hypothetical protein D6825_02435 [Candidatus Woesearchaeota archaeon]
MKHKIPIAILLISLAIAGTILWQNYSKKSRLDMTVQECLSASDERKEFLRALNEKNTEICDSLQGLLKSRCKAYINKDSSGCSPADSECIAITTKDESLCATVYCKAWILEDPSLCSQAPNPSFCKIMVTHSWQEIDSANKECLEHAKSQVLGE